MSFDFYGFSGGGIMVYDILLQPCDECLVVCRAGGDNDCARHHDWDLRSQVVECVQRRVEINNVGAAEHADFSTNRCVYFSSGRSRCLVRVADGELRLATHGRQRSRFSHQTVAHEGVSFSPICDELVVISCAFFLLSRYFGGIWLYGTYTSRGFSVCMKCFWITWRNNELLWNRRK